MAMSELIGHSGDSALMANRRSVATLSLAAAPVFALMALLTVLYGGNTPDVFCAASHASPLTGMAAMYLLMSVFHLGPWLRLIESRRDEGGQKDQGENQ
jgi:hypothetical protein